MQLITLCSVEYEFKSIKSFKRRSDALDEIQVVQEMSKHLKLLKKKL
jgi:hypothetical protein